MRSSVPQVSHSRIFRWRRTYRNLQRTRQILMILFKYGFDDILERIKIRFVFRLQQKLVPKYRRVRVEYLHPARRLRLAFGELGPTFIKLGQILSTRPDLVPPAYVKEFAKLRDEAAPLPVEVIQQQIIQDLGVPPEELFSEFDTIPVASASISQVHRARLPDGTEVAVKIRRPDIRRIVENDISILRDLAELLVRYIPEFRLYDPVGIVDEFDRSIHREMDFIYEARNIERFRRNFQEHEFIVVPRVYWDFTTPTILTMEYLRGKKFSEVIEEGLDPELRKIIVERGTKLLLAQIFDYGFFHADPHPGNIMILPDRRIALLDFGMMGNIDDELRQHLGELLYGITKKDIRLVIRRLREITEFPKELDERGLRNDIADFIDRYYNMPIAQIQFEQLINDLLEISRRHRITIPADLVLLLRALMISESIVRQLDPQFNLIEQIRPYATRLFFSKYDPLLKLRHLLEFLEDSEELLRDLPNEIKGILQKVKQGEVTVRFQHENLEELVSEMESTSTRLSFSVILGSLIVGSSLIILADKGPKLMDLSVFGLIGFLIAGIMGFWLVISILRSGKLR